MYQCCHSVRFYPYSTDFPSQNYSYGFIAAKVRIMRARMESPAYNINSRAVWTTDEKPNGKQQYAFHICSSSVMIKKCKNAQAKLSPTNIFILFW